MVFILSTANFPAYYAKYKKEREFNLKRRGKEDIA
jgi:hypothetical protein